MESTSSKPNVFIGSSRESIPIASAVHSHLKHCATVNPWYGDVFSANEYTMESLEKALNENDFGIFIFDTNDIIKVRDKVSFTARDNTVFEMGLFYGRLGRGRVFAFIPDSVPQSENMEGKPVSDFRLLSDLSGLTMPTYENSRENDQYATATSEACQSVIRAINNLGKFTDSRKAMEINDRIVTFLDQISRSTKLTKALKRDLYGNIAKNVMSAIYSPENLVVYGAALWEKHKKFDEDRQTQVEGMKHIAGNVGIDQFHEIIEEENLSEDVAQSLVSTAYVKESWVTTNYTEGDDEIIICYHIGHDIVLSVHLRIVGDFRLPADLLKYFQPWIKDNTKLFKSIKKLIGGRSS